LAAAEPNDILTNALEYYRKNKFLTPKFANVVFWRLDEHRIDYSPTFFKVHLNKNKYKSDLRDMPLSRVHRLWPALSPAQRKLAISLGHSPPP